VRAPFALALILAASLASPPEAGASAGHVQGSVRGLPSPGARVFAAARAIDRVTGRVVASTVLGPSARRYRLAVPAGRYFVAVDAARRPGGNVSRLGRSVRVRARRTTRLGVTVRAAQDVPVVGVDEINLTTASQTLKLRALAINQAFKAFSPKGIKVVDDSAQIVAAMKTEEKLAREGRSDTPFVAHPLKPTVRLGGSGTVNPDGTVSLELKLVKPDGTLVAIKSFTAKPASADDLGQFLTGATSSFAAENAGPIAEPQPAPAAGIHVAILTHQESWGGQPHGTLTITPPGVTITDPTGQVIEVVAPFGSTIHAEAHPTDARTFFAGWSTSQCGISPGNDAGNYNPTWDCTVGHENALDVFEVNIVPEFDTCPAPGTYVFGAGPATCPGVIPLS
jgi:hypothetical protein